MSNLYVEFGNGLMHQVPITASQPIFLNLSGGASARQDVLNDGQVVIDYNERGEVIGIEILALPGGES
ncbi:MAG TPA: DUF2283 domain-containing protein [Planctomycetota bacterium]|nr:DUF2283 domain-containing protein [Planctomycetota bacterium]